MPRWGCLTDLHGGFRDDEQLSRARDVVVDRLADDREQEECRYLIRFAWQLRMSYREVCVEELRAHVGAEKLAAVEALIEAVRTSHDRIDAWIEAAEQEFPVIEDRGHGIWSAQP
ncbi:hypothetical protein SK571_03500 [Lentzea sp. BCCO 10_0798]|uniref:Uncharacterized protein n=1 Tax=Lentzea kristufekii TaxID=3095430 RepID=A0ABU4TJK6_9PSEU|nr:hypothetical protein [Lentzea sp. BCCO 10_0798]MDX8048437.1 hypothetical protein [Lentzea sp. BCCO 10_0798]